MPTAVCPSTCGAQQDLCRGTACSRDDHPDLRPFSLLGHLPGVHHAVCNSAVQQLGDATLDCQPSAPSHAQTNRRRTARSVLAARTSSRLKLDPPVLMRLVPPSSAATRAAAEAQKRDRSRADREWKDAWKR